MDVECMWPGSVHDEKVFANSSINHKLRNRILPMSFQTVHQNHVKIPNYLIGDPAYPLIPYCMREYSTNEEVIFNTLLRSARNPIECAFGRLTARWKILTRKMDLKLESVPTINNSIIYACFVLHNFCEKNKVYIDEEQVHARMEVMKINEQTYKNKPDPIFSCENGEGEVIRRALTEYIKENISM